MTDTDKIVDAIDHLRITIAVLPVLFAIFAVAVAAFVKVLWRK